MHPKVESYLWFLGFLIVTKIVVAPIVNNMVPKSSAGTPLFQI